ncbi:MAG: restriction endonuclease subunit S, partial [Planctomyces sp.]
PEHWNVVSVKRRMLLRTEKTARRQNPVGLENIESWTGRFVPTETEFEGDGVEFETGDILFGKLRPYLAKVHLADGPGEAVGDFHVMRPHEEFVGRFAQYCLLCREFIAIVDGSTFGSKMPRASWEFVSTMKTPVPPFHEQTLIADFLDRETSKIDSLVAEQRRLIELLKEKRQAVISHAVTKGLNPHAPMKPSGIEWLGDVPEHWQLRRVKTVSSFVTSGPRGWSERIGETGSLFVQSGDLNDQMEVEFMTAKRVQVENDAESTRTRMREGDVVVCVTGAKTGNVAVCNIIPEPAYVNQHLCLIRPTPDVLPSFLGVLLKSRLGQIYFEISQYGLKQGLSLEDVEEAPVILPPVNEQQEIIALLDTETAKLDALTSEAERAIELLQERRTALISAAVTGKIDVRHLVEVN